MTSITAVAGMKEWNRSIFDEWSKRRNEALVFVANEEELQGLMKSAEPAERIFFIHWSGKVPRWILDRAECINFHMTDLPYGRGGSPLQNLIMEGHQSTMLTAIRMTEKVDAGPVYLKRPLGLDGTAEEIYMRCTYLSLEMIEVLLDEDLQPVDQVGEVVTFHRRNESQSEIPQSIDLDQLHDFIRMLDADGYPKAFLKLGNLVFRFSSSSKYHGRLKACVEITSGDH